ncbi:copper resistance protein C [Shinella yambaruensis]|uniref:Copper resistance protein C n=1 Tax=Shinella yambaruensis TaxID=415996 RepID=A0ABQ5ZPF3_9HYPH|nr:copper resistance protein C [Shinella yambaruensis]
MSLRFEERRKRSGSVKAGAIGVPAASVVRRAFVRDHPGRACIQVFLAGILWCCLAAAAMAHASLTGSVPADGAVVDTPPQSLSLSFSEPVSPLVLRLVLPDGQARTLGTFVLRDRVLEIVPPDGLGAGTHVLVWRVVSEDGHPVAGSTVFSIGAPSSAPPVAETAADWPVRIALWLARVALYVGLFFGIGGLFSVRWLIPGGADGLRVIRGVTLLGLAAAVLSLGFQGLDALGVPLSGLMDRTVWQAGLATRFGLTVIVLLAAFCLAVVASFRAAFAGRAASLASLLAGGGALALSGHASSAAPQWLTQPAVFVHAITIAVWIGALLPLACAVRRGGDAGRQALDRFSRLIPACVAALALAGLLLAVVQIQAFGALFSTAYGAVLLVKMALLAVLFSLVALNRWVFTRPAARGDRGATRRLVRSIIVETMIVLAVLAVAAAWRFTPPPRALALAAAQPASIHIHSDKAMAEIALTPGRAGPVRLSAVILSPDFTPLSPKEVTFVLSNPEAGIEPMRRRAALQGDGTWQATDVILPLAGRWRVRIDILVSDFELVRLQETVEIAP